MLAIMGQGIKQTMGKAMQKIKENADKCSSEQKQFLECRPELRISLKHTKLRRGLTWLQLLTISAKNQNNPKYFRHFGAPGLSVKGSYEHRVISAVLNNTDC